MVLQAVLRNIPKPETGYKYTVALQDGAIQREGSAHDVVVKIQAAALNHRDLWILRDNYPGDIKEGAVLGADSVGVLEEDSPSGKFKAGQRVLLHVGRNWINNKRGPQQDFTVLGLTPEVGTLTERVAVNEEDIFLCPEHLSDAEAAALPLAGLTAYRAVFTKGQVEAGDHILITGIGGGVALFALQYAVAVGANVYVTSSDPLKIQKAVALGAKGGINYKEADCIDKLLELLGDNRLSTIIDGAGGSLYPQYPRILQRGGYIVQYGHTSSIEEGVNFNAMFWGLNLEFRGTALGSRCEFAELVKFVDKHKLKPIVSQIWKGLTQENLDDALDVMERGDQFGKLVIEM